ncbi:MAG: molybdopterin-dependent oxidoreductase, partial [Desulfosudaceae bacterium]
MKIGRRSFLSLIVGGAAGTALTPMPLKLTDDIAIWTQNFKGFPNEVPVPKDGAATYEKSVCALCPGGCGISVRKIGDRAVKIEGQNEHPVNNGGLCNLGLSGLQLLYGPWRVKSPLKKVDDKWQEISWKQALSEISKKLETIREKDQAHQVAGLTGSSKNTVGQLLERFLTAFGSPNFFALPDSEDALELATFRMLGQKATPGFDLENSNYVMSFASNLLEGWGSPVRMFQAHSFWQERGAELIQVESRLSNTAAKADRWIPINPGTESDLALGMAYIILRDELYDDKNVS